MIQSYCEFDEITLLFFFVFFYYRMKKYISRRLYGTPMTFFFFDPTGQVKCCTYQLVWMAIKDGSSEIFL